MNATFVATEVRRIVRDPVSLFFIAGLPAFFYVVFGVAMSFADAPLGNGNTSFYIMIGMAAYGATTATASIGGRAAVERAQGWGRQLGLTPLSDRGFVLTKTLVAMIVGLVPITLIYLIGVFSGAAAPPSTWAISLVIVIVGCVVFALYGLCFGLAFGSDSAVGAASGLLVLLAFLGNIFLPLTGTMLEIARFTPLYGYIALARYPLTGGDVDGYGSALPHEPIWIPVTNVVVWTIVFAVIATILVRRGRGRQ